MHRRFQALLYKACCHRDSQAVMQPDAACNAMHELLTAACRPALVAAAVAAQLDELWVAQGWHRLPEQPFVLPSGCATLPPQFAFSRTALGAQHATCNRRHIQKEKTQVLLPGLSQSCSAAKHKLTVQRWQVHRQKSVINTDCAAQSCTG